MLQLFCVPGFWKCSNKTTMPKQICNGLVDTTFRPKILGARRGNLP